MPVDSKSRDSQPPANPPGSMPVVEGVGALMVVGGVLALIGMAVHPDMVWTFLPTGAIACLGGVVFVWWARRAPSKR